MAENFRGQVLEIFFRKQAIRIILCVVLMLLSAEEKLSIHSMEIMRYWTMTVPE